jgi:FtsP/CotA-like multicopper oxidase with cupredoxin domain
VLEVEPRRYRLRLLNGCTSRFLILTLAADPTTRPATAVLPFWMIGAEGGFLPAPVRLERLLMAPAERRDVIVDLTGLAPAPSSAWSTWARTSRSASRPSPPSPSPTRPPPGRS